MFDDTLILCMLILCLLVSFKNSFYLEHEMYARNMRKGTLEPHYYYYYYVTVKFAEIIVSIVYRKQSSC